jgi:hypothetical protein
MRVGLYMVSSYSMGTVRAITHLWLSGITAFSSVR